MGKLCVYAYNPNRSLFTDFKVMRNGEGQTRIWSSSCQPVIPWQLDANAQGMFIGNWMYMGHTYMEATGLR